MSTKRSLKDRTAAAARLACLCLALLASACAHYYEQPPHRGPASGGDVLYNIERFAPELKLTREQIQSVRQLRANFDKEAIRIDAALRAAYLDLNSLTRADRKQLDKDRVFKKADEINGLHAQMQRKIIELDLEITGVLTDEQHETFRNILNRRSRDY